MKKITFLFTILILIFSNIFYANPIPSGSALTIVAPTTITKPGNYRFGNDIAGTIVVDANNVQIDLENRTLTAGSNGISIANHANVTIKNGVITDAFANGILVDTCANVCIENITLLDSSTGISVLTTTAIKIEECSFSGHTAAALNLEHVNSGQVQACSFNFNIGFDGIIGLDCECILFENINICQNTLAAGTLNGINFINSIDMTFVNCHVDENEALGGDLNGWSLNSCIDVIIEKSSSNSNNSSGSLAGFNIFSCGNISLDFCQSNTNTTLSAFSGFIIQGASNNITFVSCAANGNLTTGGLLSGFTIVASASEVILKHCSANNNNVVIGDVRGFNIGTENNCFIKCVAKSNSTLDVGSASTGFLCEPTSAGNLFQDCIAKSNIGAGGSFGFNNSGTNNVFLRNVAQGHGALGATNFIGISTVATLDPTVGTYTPPGTGDHPNTDNVSIVLP